MLSHVEPGLIIPRRASGIGSMGDVTDLQSLARFSLATPWYRMVYVRAYFQEAESGNGATGDATLVARIDHGDRSGLYDFKLAQWLNMGMGGTANSFLNWRVPDTEREAWTLPECATIVFEWANPDDQKMRWALEVGLAKEGR